MQSMREEALEARNDPTKENAFRQFQLNQRVSAGHPVDAAAPVGRDRRPGRRGKLKHGQACFAGLDLASTTDLAAWVLLFPPRATMVRGAVAVLDAGGADPVPRHHTGGQAVGVGEEGLLTATEGDWIDYEGAIHPQIERRHDFRIVKVGYDQKEATATAQFMQRLASTSTRCTRASAVVGDQGADALVKAGRCTTAAIRWPGGTPTRSRSARTTRSASRS
jgi:phage terminase large subunit-like protein